MGNGKRTLILSYDLMFPGPVEVSLLDGHKGLGCKVWGLGF